MATATLGGLIAAARQLIPPDPDADLLRRFAATRDDGAFAALVARYGRLVLSACRRIVPDTHLADDAFQATFVVLATKAASLDGNRPLGPWLYAVASHVATRARAMIGRRRKRETLTGTVPDVPDESSGGTGFQAGDDQSAILDEEIGKLSAACRDAVVLCELQGLTRKQAAAKLGIAEGTLSSRLAAARKTLAARLRARGVAPTAGIFSTIFVSTDLVAAAVAVSTGTVDLSPQLTTLVQKGLAMTLLAKLKLVPAVVALGLLLLGAAGWGGSSNDAAVAAPVPKEKDEGLIWTHHTKTNALTAYSPDGKKAKEVALPAEAKFLGFTPDGARMLFVGMKGKLPLPDADGPLTLHVGEIDAKCEGTDTGLGWQEYDEFVWSPDGKQVVRARRENTGERPRLTFSHTLFDLATKKETAVELPARHQLMQWSADGKTWRVMYYNRADDPKLPSYRWLSMPASGGDLTPVCDDGSYLWLDPHPDGKRFLVAPVRSADVTPGQFTLATVADGKSTAVAEVAAEVDGVVCADARWSPDGTRMTALWYGIGTEKRPLGDTVLAVFDGTGMDKKTLVTVKADGQRTRLLGWFPSAPKAAAPQPKKNAPVPKAGKDDGLIWTLDGKTGTLTAFALDGTKKQDVALKSGRNFLGFSHDGELLLFLAKKGQPTEEQDGLTLHVGKPSDLARATDTGIGFDAKDHFSFHLTRDKKRVVRLQDRRSGPNPPADQTRVSFGHTLIDLATKKEAAIELDDRTQIVDESLDGKDWIAMVYNDDPKLPGYRYLRVPVGGGKPVPICDTHHFPFFFVSPDGNSYLGIGVPFPFQREVTGMNLYHFNPATGKATELEQFADTEQRNLRWSPDGKRYAVKKHGDADVFAADIDGKNRQKLFAVPDAGPETYFIGWFPAKPKANAPVPKEKPPEGVILVSKLCTDPPNEILEVLDASGKSLGHLLVGNRYNVRAARVSPDGKRLAFSLLNEKGKRHQFYDTEDLFVVDLPLTEPPKEPTFGDLLDPSFAWAPDGKTLVVSGIPGDTDVSLRAVTGTAMPRKTVRYDAATKKEKAIELPKGHAVQDMTPDGKTLLTQVKVWSEGGFKYSSFLVPLDALEAKRIGDEDDGFAVARFSPVGNRIVGTRVERAKSKGTGLFLADATTGKVDDHPLSKELTTGLLDAAVSWAPDGRRLAVLWSVPAPGLPGGAGGPPGAASRRQITVLDSDGKNAKTIREFAPTESPRHIDWADPKLREKSPAAPPPKKNAPVPKADPDPGLIWIHHQKTGKLAAYTPDGKKEMELPDGKHLPGFTPDGTKILFAGKDGRVADATDGLTLHLRDITEKPNGTDTGLEYKPSDQFVVSPDGKQIVRQRLDAVGGLGGNKPAKHEFSHVLFDVVTKKEAKTDVPVDCQIMQWTPDGRAWRVLQSHAGTEPKLPTYRWLSYPAAGGKPTPICDEASLMWLDPSPDGKTFLATGHRHPTAKPSMSALIEVNRATGKARELTRFEGVSFVVARWSPDGKRIACVKYDWDAVKEQPGDTHLLVLDADGKNEKTLFTNATDHQSVTLLGWFPTKPKTPVPK